MEVGRSALAAMVAPSSAPSARGPSGQLPLAHASVVTVDHPDLAATEDPSLAPLTEGLSDLHPWDHASWVMEGLPQWGDGSCQAPETARRQHVLASAAHVARLADHLPQDVHAVAPLPDGPADAHAASPEDAHLARHV